jgi:hypothetical protein
MRGAVTLAVVGAAVLVAGEAHAFCRSTTCRDKADQPCEKDEKRCPSTGNKLYWPTSCITYALNKRGSTRLVFEEARGVIHTAFEQWNQVDCGGGKHPSMHIREREPVSCRKTEYNEKGKNVNVVFFQDDYWAYRSTDATLAKTSVTFNSDTGEILDADIEINTANSVVTIADPPERVEQDLGSILTHEVGHFIGIAHSIEDGSVMAESYNAGDIKRKLAPDDVEAICAIYPPDNGVGCNDEPRGGFSDTCGGDDDPSTVPKCSAGGIPASPTYTLVGLFGIVLAACLVRGRIR